MAFSVYTFICIACLLHKPTRRLTSDTNDFVNAQSDAREKNLCSLPGLYLLTPFRTQSTAYGSKFKVARFLPGCWHLMRTPA